MTIWQLERQLSRRLVLWSVVSMVAGALLLFASDFWRGFGLQCLVWGSIDLLIALLGQRSLNKKLREAKNASEEARSLKRILLINAGLDVVYILIGVGIWIVWGRTGAFTVGNAVGVLLQGSFLLGFDLFYARQVISS